MALNDGWPAASGVADQIEIRKGLAGLIIRDTAGTARAGVFPRHVNALVTATATMNVAVAAFEAAAVRAGGPVFLNNDGSVNVLLDAAPGANSRYDVVWVRQKENGYGGLADGSNGAEFGFTKGTASASPSKATVLDAIPAGAIPLAAILIPSTATATNSGGVVITQEFPYTTVTGGKIWARTASDLTAVSGYAVNVRAWTIDTEVEYRFDGTNWKPWETSSPVSYYLSSNLVNYAVATDTPLLTWSARAGRILVEVKVVITSGGGFSGTFQVLLPFAAASKYATSSAQWAVGTGTYLQPTVNAHRFDVVISGGTLDRVTPVLLGAAGTYVNPGAAINGSTPVAQSAGYQVTAIFEYDPA